MSEPNGVARTNAVIVTVAAVLGMVAIIGTTIWFAISVAIAPVQRDLDRSAQDIKDIRIDLVPRREHDRDWAAQDARFSDLQRQIQDNKDNIEKIYTPGDAIKRLQERIDQLDAEIHHEKKP